MAEKKREKDFIEGPQEKGGKDLIADAPTSLIETAHPVISHPPTIKARNRTNTLLTLADGAAFPRNRTMEIPEDDFKRFSALGWVVAV